MTLEVIIIVIVTIAGILAALAIRFAYSIHGWAELVGELQDENDALRADTGELCKEKLSLMIDVDDLRSENDHLKNQLDDALTAYENSEKERIRIITATTAKRIIEPAPVEPESAAARSVPEIDWTFDRLPDAPTNFYTCEPYDRFAKNSDQAILQEECFTDAHTGIRYITIDGIAYKCAAMATAYGTDIGNTFEIELECGTVERIIMADFKHDISKPSANDFGDSCVNYDGRDCINVIEFVCDMKEVDPVVKNTGTMGVLNEYGGIYGTDGNIKRITFTGRKWEP